MRVLIVGGGMGGLFAAIALREAGVFTSIDVYEQTRTPSTAGAGLNIAPNGARLCKWLGIDLDGGDPKGPQGVIDGGRAAILEATREIFPDGSVSRKPIDHDTAAKDGAGFHHMHRMDLLMCLYKRALELGPDSGVACPIRVHMSKRLASLEQDAGTVTARFADGTEATGELLIGADGINSEVVRQVWPNNPKRRWTAVTCYRGLIPRAKVAGLRKADGSPMDHNPVDSLSMDVRKTQRAWALTYWVRGGELLNVWAAYYEPNSAAFEGDEGDWFAADPAEMRERMGIAFEGDVRLDDVLALVGGIEKPTKWGLYDRDAFEHWTDGRICLLGDAAHPMLPTMGQAATQSFEDGAALSMAFKLHREDVYSALLHYERVRHYRATRFQFGSKFLFKHLEPEDSPERRAILAAVDERDYSFRAPRRCRRARRLRRTCGCRRFRSRATAASRARRWRSAPRSRTAGSSSAARSTTSASGRTATRAGPSWRACMPARIRPRSSATTTPSSPRSTWRTSAWANWFSLPAPGFCARDP